MEHSTVTGGIIMEQLIWSYVLLTYGAGDILTTWYGLKTGLVEKNPILRGLINQYGVNTAMLFGAIQKLIVISFFWGITLLSPYFVDLGVYLGLSVVGTVIVVNNLLVLRGSKGLTEYVDPFAIWK